MDMMSMFRRTPAQMNAQSQVTNAGGKPQQQQQPQRQGNPDPNNVNNVNNSGQQDFNNAGNMGGDGNSSGNDGKNTQNPLDAFKGMFYNDNSGGNKDAPPVFQIDPKVLEDVAGKLSFAQVTPELAQKLQSGDPTALQQTLDDLGRRVYSTAVQHLSSLTDKFVTARTEHDRKGLGQSVRSELTSNRLSQLAENNPVLKEHVTSVGSMLASKYPDASPDWIAEQTKSYFVTMAKQLDPSLNAAASGNKGADGGGGGGQPENVDWASWLSQGPKT